MANFVDYLTQYANIPFSVHPLNEIDMLILSEMTYFAWDGLVAPDFSSTSEKRFEEIWATAQNLPLDNQDRLPLLEKLAHSRRFANIRLTGFENDLDPEIQKQFAAICYRLQPQHYLVSFRGTDETVIGWKEDFKMTYLEEVPAQSHAVDYLKRALAAFPQARFDLSGHSKGGNLAVFSASQLAATQQERIGSIYSFDGPGLHKSKIEEAGYQAILPRIKAYLPQGSIVGMMLEIPKEVILVTSNGVSIGQHLLNTWEIDPNGHQLLRADRLTPDSIQTDQTLKHWTASLSDEQLKNFFDILFDLFLNAGIERITDFKSGTLQKLFAVLQQNVNLSQEEKALLVVLFRLLWGTRFQQWRADLPAFPPRPSLFLPNRAKNDDQN